MRTHAAIIRSAGSAEKVAENRGISIHTVRSWITRDSIPAEQWASFANEGAGTLEEMAAYAAARRRGDMGQTYVISGASNSTNDARKAFGE